MTPEEQAEVDRLLGASPCTSGGGLPWREWVAAHFPEVCRAPFGVRHVRLWEWFESLKPGETPRARVEAWPRGGAKSTTAELGVARVGVKLSRRYVLYVSETQDQADKHVQSIGSLLESIGVPRALTVYGHSKGWRRQELRTQSGFNVSAYGLDTAARGVKLDQYRPDLIILDDIDSQDDSPRITEKKILAITTAIIPAGSSDCALLFIQNLVHEESIFAQLVENRADFLHDREPAYLEPAVRDLEVEARDRGDGLKRYFITGGVPTWQGQDLAVCERQINDWGLGAFKREAQHEVAGAAGYFFDVRQLQPIARKDVPLGLRMCRAWDFAATQGGGDWTAGYLQGVAGQTPEVKCYIFDGARGQWSAEGVKQQVVSKARADGSDTIVRIPQDPGQAGKAQVGEYERHFSSALPEFTISAKPMSGSKATRATPFAEALNLGNVYYVLNEDGLTPDWVQPMKDCLRRFKEHTDNQQDDDVDALADGYNELVGEVEIWAY
jgi:predicted phage terminase large subunit-like protein